MAIKQVKIFAVRIGEKFGQDVEDYIESKLPNVTWIRDELPSVRLQWNKMRVMNMNIDAPVVVTLPRAAPHRAMRGKQERGNPQNRE